MLPLGFNDDDDDELLAELAHFDEEMDDEVPHEPPGTIGVTVDDLELPSVPLMPPDRPSNSVDIILSDDPIAL